MITPLLEELIFKGRANYSVWTHANGMFGRINAPKNQITVITDFIYYPFINWPTAGDIFTTSYNQLFRSCEYQLRIEGQITNTSYVMRNSLKIFKSGISNIDLDSNITVSGLKSILIQTGEPVKIDCFIPCGDYAKITISRNSYTASFGNTMGFVDQSATEPISPNGVGDSSTLLYQSLTDSDGNIMNYTPVGEQYAGTAYVPNDRNHNNYNFDIQKNGGSGDILSELNEPYPNNYYFATPLINFGMVTINKNYADKLMNT